MIDQKPKFANELKLTKADKPNKNGRIERRFTAPAGSTPTSELIRAAIDWNEAYKPKYQALNMYYEGQHEILGRKKPENLSNNKAVINHAEYITDLYVGYLVGQPIEYEVKPDTETKKVEYDITAILEEYDEQTIEDLDADLATDLSIYGRAFEQIYADQENNVRSAKIEPVNAVMVYDNTVQHNKLFAITYERVEVKSKTESKYIGVQVMTADFITQYNEDLVEGTSETHYFGEVPMIEYINNTKIKGDFEGVVSLIDAYNLLQSDRLNDKEQLIEAILVIYGFDLTDEQLKRLKDYRVMTAPPQLKGTKAEYLIKALNEGEVDILRKNFEQDIHKISKTPNMSDENFIGNASGVALKYKILPFEWRANAKQRKMTKGLRERFRLYNTYLQRNSVMSELVPVHKLDVNFKRNLPQNDYEASQMVNNLTDTVSRKTLLGQLSFVGNPDEEIAQQQAEAQERFKAFGDAFGSNQPNMANLNDKENTPTDEDNTSDE